MSISTLNVNGWTAHNGELRKQNISNLNSDIISVCETHLHSTDSIVFDGYKWYGFNRTGLHINAKRLSCGVGVLIKETLLQIFKVSVCDKIYEGILGVQLQNIYTDFVLQVYECYLPPEGSPWANSTQLFGHIIAQLCLSSEVDAIFFCGDFNARTGCLKDCIDDIDNIPQRNVIDTNAYGKQFIDFLQETKMCILNGRVTSDKNDLTFVSKRGSFVVDYIITPHECLDQCVSSRVDRVNDILEKYNLYSMLSNVCKAPDHSVVTITIRCNIDVSTEEHEVSNNNNCVTNETNLQHKKYKFESIPPELMNNDIWKHPVSELIMHIESSNSSKESVNELYADLCDVFFQEMDNFLDYNNVSTKTKKMFKNYRPYWNNELTIAWKNMHNNEKIFRRCKATH